MEEFSAECHSVDSSGDSKVLRGSQWGSGFYG